MNLSELGKQLRARRRTLGLTQRALAEIAGLSVHGLSNLESGTGNPTFAVLAQVTEALGLELHLSVPTPGGARREPQGH